ncbi:hypothetical protein Tco_0169166 [Tanacetum coccineum]
MGKSHMVPVVAYFEDGLSLLATQVGTHIMLDVFASAMYVEAWGRVGYVKSLIKVYIDNELKHEVTMAIPNVEDAGETHILEKVRIEYEWKPPVCLDCHVFGHSNDQCPKRVLEKIMPDVEVHDDGFIMVNNKIAKGKSAAPNQKGNFNGVKINPPKKNFIYRPVQKPTTNTTIAAINTSNGESSNGVKLQNLFEKLNEITSIVDPSDEKGKEETGGEFTSKNVSNGDDSDSEIGEVFTKENPNTFIKKGASDGFSIP